MLKFLQLADYKRAKVLPKLFWQHFGKNAAKIAPDFWQRFGEIAGICGNTKPLQHLINKGFNNSFAAGKSGFLRADKIRCQNCQNHFLPSRFYALPIIPTTP